MRPFPFFRLRTAPFGKIFRNLPNIGFLKRNPVYGDKSPRKGTTR